MTMTSESFDKHWLMLYFSLSYYTFSFKVLPPQHCSPVPVTMQWLLQLCLPVASPQLHAITSNSFHLGHTTLLLSCSFITYFWRSLQFAVCGAHLNCFTITRVVHRGSFPVFRHSSMRYLTNSSFRETED